MQPNSLTKFRPSPKQWQCLAIGVWALVFLGLLIRLLVAHGLHSVYPIFADAARCWSRGDDMYWPHHYVQGLDPYRYSPAVAQFFSSFASLSDRLGSIFWLTLNTVLIAAGLLWWLKVALPRELGPSQVAGAGLLLLTFAAGNLHNGQANTMVTAMLLMAAAGACTERWTLVSCCLVVATLFKVYPLAFGMLLVLAAPRQLLPRLTLALLCGLALPFLVRSPEYVIRQYQHWFEVVRLDNRRHAELPVCYRDLWLLVRVSGAPFSSASYTVLQGVGAAATAGFCLWGKWSGLNMRQLTMLSLTMAALWMMLLGPATESSTYLLLAPTLTWIVFDVWNSPGYRIENILLGGSLCCFCLAHVCVWFPVEVRRGAIVFQPAGTLLLSAVAVRRAYSEITECRQRLAPVVEGQRRLAA